MKNQVTKVVNEASLEGILCGPKFKQELMKVLPKTLTPDKFVRIVLTEIRANPELLKCTTASFLGAVMRSAQIGLEPSSERKHVHLIPYRNNKMNRTDCQLIIGYRGFLALAAQSNIFIESDVIYANDFFEFQKGIDTKCKFIPNMDGDRGEVRGAYALARAFLPNGDIIYIPELMSKSDIDKTMSKSPGASRSDSPWRTHYPEMARKTPIRKLINYIPHVDARLLLAASADESAETGVQDNSSLIDGMFDSVNEQTGEVVHSEAPITKADEVADKLEKQLNARQEGYENKELL